MLSRISKDENNRVNKHIRPSKNYSSASVIMTDSDTTSNPSGVRAPVGHYSFSAKSSDSESTISSKTSVVRSPVGHYSFSAKSSDSESTDSSNTNTRTNSSAPSISTVSSTARLLNNNGDSSSQIS